MWFAVCKPGYISCSRLLVQVTGTSNKSDVQCPLLMPLPALLTGQPSPTNPIVLWSCWKLSRGLWNGEMRSILHAMEMIPVENYWYGTLYCAILIQTGSTKLENYHHTPSVYTL
jgi:hypothetical protein